MKNGHHRQDHLLISLQYCSTSTPPSTTIDANGKHQSGSSPPGLRCTIREKSKLMGRTRVLLTYIDRHTKTKHRIPYTYTTNKRINRTHIHQHTQNTLIFQAWNKGGGSATENRTKWDIEDEDGNTNSTAIGNESIDNKLPTKLKKTQKIHVYEINLRKNGHF